VSIERELMVTVNESKKDRDEASSSLEIEVEVDRDGYPEIQTRLGCRAQGPPFSNDMWNLSYSAQSALSLGTMGRRDQARSTESQLRHHDLMRMTMSSFSPHVCS